MSSRTHPGHRSWRGTYGYGRIESQQKGLCPCSPFSGEQLCGLVLVIGMGIGAHATKRSLGPMEPALVRMGVGPVSFGFLTVVPGLASVLLPTVWGEAWARHARHVLLLSPLAQLAAQALLAGGAYLLATSHSSLAPFVLGVGMVLFSVGRAGIAVAQHATLARLFTLGLAPAFAITIACSQLIDAAANWTVPRVFTSAADATSGLVWLQCALLAPHALSSLAGAALSRWYDPDADDDAAEPAAPPSPSRGDAPIPPPWRPAILLLASWRAFAVGTFHAIHPLFVALLSSVGVPWVEAGHVIATNLTLSLVGFALVAALGRLAKLKLLLIGVPLLALVAASALRAVTATAAGWAAEPSGLEVELRWCAYWLLALNFAEAIAPCVPLALVPANSAVHGIGRSYGLVEALFEAAEIAISISLGVLRALGGGGGEHGEHGRPEQVGGFQAALLLVIGGFAAALITSAPLVWGAREGALYLPSRPGSHASGLSSLAQRDAAKASADEEEEWRARLLEAIPEQPEASGALAQNGSARDRMPGEHTVYTAWVGGL